MRTLLEFAQLSVRLYRSAHTIVSNLILGTTYTGEYEDVKAINDLLIEKDLKTPIHVDAASGGFVAPFVV